jgi:hypothetical protein
VVSEDGAQACELVDDPAVAAPEGWASESTVSEEPGTAAASQDATTAERTVAERAAAAEAVENRESITITESSEGEDTTLVQDLSAYAAQGVTVDADGTPRYLGEPLKALVLDRGDEVLSLVWNDAGSVYLAVEGDTLRVLTDEEVTALFG